MFWIISFVFLVIGIVRQYTKNNKGDYLEIYLISLLI
jgi:hypothetical protein